LPTLWGFVGRSRLALVGPAKILRTDGSIKSRICSICGKSGFVGGILKSAF